jgi:hypothetical protein
VTEHNGPIQETSARAAEPSTAEASRLLAKRIGREDAVVAHGSVPFRSAEPRRRRPYVRFALTVLVGFLLAVVLAVVLVLVVAFVAG